MFASVFMPIKAVWSNFLVVRQMFAYGFMGVILAIVMAVLCFVVDVIASLVGFVFTLPVFLFRGLFKLIFGRL